MICLHVWLAPMIQTLIWLIETCFYDGMNAYSKTWLQFVFPVYLWVLVGLKILISHYLQKFAARQQPSFCLGNTDSPFIFKDPLHIGRCSPFHSTKVSDLYHKGVAVWCIWLPVVRSSQSHTHLWNETFLATRESVSVLQVTWTRFLNHLCILGAGNHTTLKVH